MAKNLFTLLLAVIVTSYAVAQHTKTTGVFRAAVVKVDITPETPQWLRGYNPRQSTEVHDKIYHRIVALDDGKTQFYLISSEVVGIPVPEYERVAEKLKKTMGTNVLFSNLITLVTRTALYDRDLITLLNSALLRAMRVQKPCLLSSGCSSVSFRTAA